MFGRSRFHSRGKDIILCLNPYEAGLAVKWSDIFIEYIEIKREYRYHIFKGQCLSALKKVLPKDIRLSSFYIKSHQKGWKFISVKINKKVSEECVKILKILDLDFGAVDLVRDKNGKYIYLEVNTAPGLVEGIALNKYIENFKKFLEG